MIKEYLSLDKLEAYRLSRQLSILAWQAYESFDWRVKKIVGDQFIASVDSTGANIAEGYGRFHYLDIYKDLRIILNGLINSTMKAKIG